MKIALHAKTLEPHLSDTFITIIYIKSTKMHPLLIRWRNEKKKKKEKNHSCLLWFGLKHKPYEKAKKKLNDQHDT